MINVKSYWRGLFGWSVPRVQPKGCGAIGGRPQLESAKLISLIEEESGAIVPLAAVFKAPTIRQLASLMLDNATFGMHIVDEAIVCLSGQTSGPNIFVSPPGTGDAAGFIQIAQQMKAYCFCGFNFIEAESRISDYADLVASIDPKGPHLSFGYSSGGNLAYHVAREIENRCRRVSDIVMIDSARKFERTPYSPEEVRRIADNFLNLESNKPYLRSQVLIDKAYRLIQRSYAYHDTSVDYHIVNANIHVVEAKGKIDVVRDESHRVLVSRSGAGYR